MEMYVRRNGNLTPASQKALAAQIEKRMVQNSTLYMDYKEAKSKDAKKDGYADTWKGALWRWASVIQEVRDIVAVGAKYGNLMVTRHHTYRDDGSAEDVGTMELRGTADKSTAPKATNKSAMKTTSTSFSAVESSTGQKPITLDKPISKRVQDMNTSDEKGIFVMGTAACNRCGQIGHRAENCPFTGAQDTNARTEHTWTEPLKNNAEEMRSRLF